MSKVSLRSPIIAVVLIKRVRKIQENEGQEGGGARDHVNEPAAANAELQHSGSKWPSGTVFFCNICCYCVGKAIHLRRAVFLLSSCKSICEFIQQREVPNLTWCAVCVSMEGELKVIVSCSTFLFRGPIPDPCSKLSTSTQQVGPGSN